MRLLVLQLVPPLGRLEVGLEPRRGAAAAAATRPHPGRPRHARRHRCRPAPTRRPSAINSRARNPTARRLRRGPALVGGGTRGARVGFPGGGRRIRAAERERTEEETRKLWLAGSIWGRRSGDGEMARCNLEAEEQVKKTAALLFFR